MPCGCSASSKKLIYACSGAANTGLLADLVARRLTLQGSGKMTCLAGIGAGLDNFVQAAVQAEINLVIDGCPVSCGRKAFERCGLPCLALDLTQFGVEKGSTLIDESVVARVTDAVSARAGLRS